MEPQTDQYYTDPAVIDRDRKDGLVPAWIIFPSHDPEFDLHIMPANTEADHRAALQYAKERLEELWDSRTLGGPSGAVTMHMQMVVKELTW